MPDTSEQRVADVTPRALPLGGGGCTMAFGLPFATLGTLFFLLGVTGRIPARDASASSLVGLLLASAGSWIVVRGFGGWRRARRAQRLRVQYPQEPWRADHDWDRTGAWSTTPGGFGCLLFLLAVLALVAPLALKEWHRALEDEAFHAAATARSARGLWEAAPGVLQVMAVAGAAIVALALVVLFQAVRYRMLYRPARLEYGRYPYLLGEPVEGRVRMGAPDGGFRRVRLTLRCLQERNERGSKRGSNVIHVYQLWADERVFERETLGAARDLALPFRFHAPPDARLATELAGLPPRYWVLDVKGEADTEFVARFLVPLYARG